MSQTTATAAFKVYPIQNGWSGWVRLTLPNEPPEGFMEWCNEQHIVAYAQEPHVHEGQHTYRMWLFNAKDDQPQPLQFQILMFLEEARVQLGCELNVENQGIHVPGLPGADWFGAARSSGSHWFTYYPPTFWTDVFGPSGDPAMPPVRPSGANWGVFTSGLARELQLPRPIGHYVPVYPERKRPLTTPEPEDPPQWKPGLKDRLFSIGDKIVVRLLLLAMEVLVVPIVKICLVIRWLRGIR